MTSYPKQATGNMRTRTPRQNVRRMKGLYVSWTAQKAFGVNCSILLDRQLRREKMGIFL